MKATLAEALAKRRAALGPDTRLFRWVDLELPAVTVDLLGEVAVLSVYSDEARAQEASLAAALGELTPLRAVYVKRRPKEARRLANEAKDDLAPVVPLTGEPVERLVEPELGVQFELRPGNGLSVGLYLDARDARAWVRANAAGRRVLNTFAYTCGFGVAAALGRASRVVNLDLSRRVLDWGQANYGHNGLRAEARDFIFGDAFEWLGRLAKKGERFELVVLDPPGFATMGKGRFSAARDYHLLVAQAAALVPAGGLLATLCNVEDLAPAAFEAAVARGLGGRGARVVARLGASAVDFRQPSTLKCTVYELS